MRPEITIAEALRAARAALAQAGCDTAALDARLLMQHALGGISHAGLIAAENDVLAAAASDRFRALLARRRAREPVARILGERAFYGRSFTVGPDTLDPRADTETLVETARAIAARHWPDGRGLSIADLGTGTGAIIITLLAELPQARGFASDLSVGALAVAETNAQRHGVADRLSLLHADWFGRQDPGPFDLIVSNPPYIETAALAGLAPEVAQFDPRLALDGGPDGLVCYRAIAELTPRHLKTGGYLVLETGAGQAEAVRDLLYSGGFEAAAGFPSLTMDLGHHLRVVTVRKA